MQVVNYAYHKQTLRIFTYFSDRRDEPLEHTLRGLFFGVELR
ncbi:hypothetical protein [Paenibacillus sp. NPDC055715]